MNKTVYTGAKWILVSPSSENMHLQGTTILDSSTLDENHIETRARMLFLGDPNRIIVVFKPVRAFRKKKPSVFDSLLQEGGIEIEEI